MSEQKLKDREMKKMRFLTLAGLVALVMLVAMPAAVSAAGSDTVVVSGSIGTTMEVNALAATIDFGSMTNTTPATGSTNVNVVTTSTSWNVKASDANTATKGYLYKTGPVKLTYPLYFGTVASPTGTLVTDISNFMSGTSAGSFDQMAYIKQVIAVADSSGAYTMTITFTGTAT
jgi:hypothetical protein